MRKWRRQKPAQEQKIESQIPGPSFLLESPQFYFLSEEKEVEKDRKLLSPVSPRRWKDETA